MLQRLGLFLVFALVMPVAILASASSVLAQSKKELNAKQIRDRLNKIFYWQLADELKLSPAQEKAVVAALENAQNKRDAALAQREEALAALQKLPKTASLEESRPHLDRYSSALASLAAVEAEEYAALKAAIGEELLGRFYVIREDVTSRVRKALKK
jgi:hypothetical protein